jgi:hypothetical protein
MKSSVNFTNVLQATFMLVDPKWVKNTGKSSVYLFTLLGSARVKAVHRMLMKLSPDFAIVL